MSISDYNVLKAGDTDETLGKVIKEVILTSTTFIVYMDENDVIQWSGYDNKHWEGNFGKIQNDVSYWESISNKLFSRSDSYDYKTLLAEAYARMLDNGDENAAQQIINETVNRIKIQGKEILRQQYLFSSLITTFFVFIGIILTIINKKSFESDEYSILLTGLFGGIGAFLSTMIRAKNYEAEIISGKRVHQVDGFLRIIYGLIAGVVISLGMKSDIIFGVFAKSHSINYIEIFIGIISGASEVILPNIIKKIESKI